MDSKVSFLKDHSALDPKLNMQNHGKAEINQNHTPPKLKYEFLNYKILLKTILYFSQYFLAVQGDFTKLFTFDI